MRVITNTGATVGLFAALAITGCSSGGAGSELTVKPSAMMLPEKEGQAIHLPKDAKYSIHVAPSQRAPGLEGKADAGSDASPDGHASAMASVDNGGTASATFQLGHAFQNTSDKQVDLRISMHAATEYALELDPRGNSPDATVTLGLYARGGRNQLLKSQALMTITTEVGSASGKDSKDQQLVVTVAPHDTVSVFVAGNVAIDTRPGRKAGGMIKLTDLQLDLVPTPAPEIKTAPSTAPTTKPAAASNP